MSIASQLTAYENGLTDSYNMVSQMGGTMPVHKNMSSLASSIATIPSGGGGTPFTVPLMLDANGKIAVGSDTAFTLTFPSGFTGFLTDTSYVNQFAYMFYQCAGLTKVDMSAFSAELVSSPSAMFRGCLDLEEADLSGITGISSTSSGALSNWFYGCTKLSKVDLSNVLRIGRMGLNYAFYGCTSLQSVTFDSLEYVYGQNALQNAFYGCTSLTTVNFPAFNQSSYASITPTTPMTNMLKNCSNVTVHFPSSQQATVSAWASTQAGFSGTNTTVLYDL